MWRPVAPVAPSTKIFILERQDSREKRDLTLRVKNSRDLNHIRAKLTKRTIPAEFKLRLVSLVRSLLNWRRF
jgi:hypothetical protein